MFKTILLANFFAGYALGCGDATNSCLGLKTGTVSNAQSDTGVHVRFFADGVWSGYTELDNPGCNDYESGNTDWFPSVVCPANPTAIGFKMQAGTDGWYMDAFYISGRAVNTFNDPDAPLDSNGNNEVDGIWFDQGAGATSFSSGYFAIDLDGNILSRDPNYTPPLTENCGLLDIDFFLDVCSENHGNLRTRIGSNEQGDTALEGRVTALEGRVDQESNQITAVNDRVDDLRAIFQGLDFAKSNNQPNIIKEPKAAIPNDIVQLLLIVVIAVQILGFTCGLFICYKGGVFAKMFSQKHYQMYSRVVHNSSSADESTSLN